MAENAPPLTRLTAYRNSRVLVTGASGFIGARLCARLRAIGGEVHGVSRTVQSPTKDLHWWQADLTDYPQVQRVVAAVRPDYIFHMASEVTGRRELAVVLPTLHGNLVSGVNLLVAAASAKCRRILLAGSLEEPDTGESETLLGSPYAAAKWAASAYVRMCHQLFETPAVVARIFMVYGPGQRDLQRLIPYVTVTLLRGEQPNLSSGTRPVDWVHIEDVVAGLLAIGLAPGVEGARIDLGSGQLVTVRRVVEMLCALVDPAAEPLFGALPDRPMEQVRCARVDDRGKIGWRPEIALEAGLKDTVDWYRKQLQAGVLRPDRTGTIRFI